MRNVQLDFIDVVSTPQVRKLVLPNIVAGTQPLDLMYELSLEYFANFEDRVRGGCNICDQVEPCDDFPSFSGLEEYVSRSRTTKSFSESLHISGTLLNDRNASLQLSIFSLTKIQRDNNLDHSDGFCTGIYHYVRESSYNGIVDLVNKSKCDHVDYNIENAVEYILKVPILNPITNERLNTRIPLMLHLSLALVQVYLLTYSLLPTSLIRTHKFT